MASLLTSVMGNTNKVVEYIKECSALKIEVLKPDINKSFSKFSVEGKNIRFGLTAIKNLGVNVIESIVSEREQNGDYKDLVDLVKRINSSDLNKKGIESLIKCGAFDNISKNRATLLNGYEQLLQSVSKDRKNNLKGQISLFDSFEVEEEISFTQMKEVEELDEKTKLSLEKEVLGLYVSSHPLSRYEKLLKRKTSTDTSKINSLKEEKENYESLDKQSVIMGGMITSKTIKATKNNSIMAFLEMEDLYSSIEVVVFPKVFDKFKDLLMEDNIVLIKGRLNIIEDEAKLIAESFELLDDEKSLWIKINSFDNKSHLSDIINICKNYQGKDELIFFENSTRKILKYNSLSINICDELIKNLQSIVNIDDIKIKKI